MSTMLDDFDPVALAESLVTSTIVKAVTSKPRTAAGKKRKHLAKPAKPKEPDIIDNIYMVDGINKSDMSNNSLREIGSIDQFLGNNTGKDVQFTVPEVRFLLYYLQNGMEIKRAMKTAGYTDLKDGALYSRAKTILKRYAAQVEDKRNIFRDIGLSEAQVALNIKELTESARGEMVRLNANALAAKCLRLGDEPQATHQGVTINIYTGTGGQDGKAAPERPGTQVNTQIIQTTKPLQITR